jgi:hypothetical protein
MWHSSIVRIGTPQCLRKVKAASGCKNQQQQNSMPSCRKTIARQCLVNDHVEPAKDAAVLGKRNRVAENACCVGRYGGIAATPDACIN